MAPERLRISYYKRALGCQFAQSGYSKRALPLGKLTGHSAPTGVDRSYRRIKFARMNAPPVVVKQVAAAIIEREGRVLVTRRGPGQHLAGSWEFPGGKLECGETPQSCIIRELAEELCVTVTAGKIITESLYEYPGGAINLIAVATHLEGQALCLTVHDASEWLEPHQLLNIALAPADVPIARELIRRRGCASPVAA
jgi:8-oxo-dGTP diphosphatase